MAQRASVSMSRPSIDSSTSELSGVPESLLGSNTSSVAYLVYANRGDAYSAGYKAPTTRDIPQIKLPRVEQPENSAQIIQRAKKLAILGGNTNSDGALPGETSSKSSLGNVSDQPDGHISSSEKKKLKDEHVPAIFFSENFKLDNPRVFDEVIGEGDSTLIQEKLSWYIDIVEAQLEHEIASSSTQFFNATTQFSQIQAQAAATTEKISSFSRIAEKQHEIVQYEQNTSLIKEKLASARQISQALDMIDELKRLTDAAEAKPNHYDALLKAQQFVTEQKSSGVDLSRVIAAQQFLERLESNEIVMRKSAASNYASAMIHELKADAATGGKSAHLINGSSESDEALKVVEKLGAYELAREAYAQEIDREVIRVVKSNMPGERESNSQPLARALHNLSHEEADKMYTTMFKEIISLLQALSRQVLKSSSNRDSNGEALHSKSIIVDTVRNADSRIVRVLRVRKDPVTALTVPEFLQFSAQVHELCTAAREITGGEAETTVYEFLVAQTKLYIHTIHTAAEEELAHAMDSDDWKRTEVSSKAQQKVDLIAQSAISDSALLNTDSSSEETSKEPFRSPRDTSSPVKRTKSTSRVLLDSDAFLVSKSTLQLASLLIPYVQLSCGLPVQQLESISTSLLELLRGYNNRLHHLVLQHGATKTAGLKHISVRNLIFAFECLRFVEALLNPIKLCLKRHYEGNFSQIGTSLDAVQQLFFDHRSEIQRKLVKLMSDKASAYTRYISTIDWSQPMSERPVSKNNIVELMRQTVTVVHVAQEMMSPEQSVQIVQEIYAVYKQKFLEVYSNIQVNTVQEKQNVLNDLAYFKQKSENIQGAGNTADVVYESVNGFVAPDLPEVDQNVPLAAPEDSAPRRSLEVPEADASIAYTPDETMHEDDAVESSSTNKNVLPNFNPNSTDTTDTESATPSDTTQLENETPQQKDTESENNQTEPSKDAAEKPSTDSSNESEAKSTPDDNSEKPMVSSDETKEKSQEPVKSEEISELIEEPSSIKQLNKEAIKSPIETSPEAEREESSRTGKTEPERTEGEKPEGEKPEGEKPEVERSQEEKLEESTETDAGKGDTETASTEKTPTESVKSGNKTTETETEPKSTTGDTAYGTSDGVETEAARKIEEDNGASSNSVSNKDEEKSTEVSDSTQAAEGVAPSNGGSTPAPKPKKNNNNKKKNKKNKKK